GVAGHRVLRLLLCPDEEDGAPVGDQIANEAVGHVDPLQRLIEVDDVDAVALTEDETAHLRVPPARLVAEVNPGFQQLLHGYNGHGCSFPSVGQPVRSASQDSGGATVGAHSGDKALHVVWGRKSWYRRAETACTLWPVRPSPARPRAAHAAPRSAPPMRERSWNTALVWI